MSRNVSVLLVIGALGLAAAGYGIWKDDRSGVRLVELCVAATLVFAPRFMDRSEARD